MGLVMIFLGARGRWILVRRLPSVVSSGRVCGAFVGVLVAVWVGGVSSAVANTVSWSVSRMPLRYASFYDVSCASASACMAVGDAGEPPVAALWDGRHWHSRPPVYPPGRNGGRSASLYGVSCTSNTGCTAVGEYLQYVCEGGVVMG
jgi:hypothetical protein